ncbi:hypothetical protein RB195_005404 [Necator americanus]|uniref:Endonuclease/exonuclease/phosphatase domain-containing protein n=1 Tax=Necator americanus TaxID=51031 RepID=A0ABR1BMP5_NECAM
MAICTYNARTLASEAATEDLMMQAKKIKYDVIGLTETRRRQPLNAVYETGEELFLGTCDSRGVGGVGVLVNTSMAKNIDSFEQLTTRIGRLRKKMWYNTSFDYLRRSNIKLRRCRSRSFLYGPGEVLPRRSCLLQGHNWRFQRQGWTKKNAGGTSHRDPRPTME